MVTVNYGRILCHIQFSDSTFKNSEDQIKYDCNTYSLEGAIS